MNYYLILELAIDPPASDWAVLDAAIRAKESEWNRNVNHPTKGLYYQYLKSKAREMRASLSQKIRWSEMAKEALEQRRQELVDLLLLLSGHRGYLFRAEVDEIRKRFKDLSKSTIDDQIRLISIREEKDSAAATLPQKDESFQLTENETMERIETYLKIIEKNDLYELLKCKTTSSIFTLQQAIRELYERTTKQSAKTPEVSAIAELAGIAKVLFATEESRRAYDLSQKLMISGQKLPLAFNLRAIGKNVTRADYLQSIVEARGLGLSEKHAEWFVYDYYVNKRKCTCPELTEENLKLTNIYKQCPVCFMLHDAKAVHCKSCGVPFETKCPKCARIVRFDESYCQDCGFSVGDMPNVYPALENARVALDANDFESAQKFLGQAAKFWPNHPDVVLLQDELQEKSRQESERRLEEQKLEKVKRIKSSQLNQVIRAAMAHRRYYLANDTLMELKNHDPDSPWIAVHEPVIRERIALVEKQLENVFAHRGSQERYHFFAGILALCADSPEALAGVQEIPPTSPEQVLAVPKQVGIHVTWTPSPAEGKITYTLVRNDGKKLCKETEQLTFWDAGPEIGRNYTYTVYAERFGVPNPVGTTSSPVMLTEDVGDIRVIPANGRLELAWTPPKNAVAVRVVRDETVEIPDVRLHGVDDFALMNGQPYTYQIQALFEGIHGEMIPSSGKTCLGIPNPPPEPIRQLQMKIVDDEAFFHWTPQIKSEVWLFEFPERSPFLPSSTVPGGITALRELCGEPLLLTDPRNGKTVWRLSFVGKRQVQIFTVEKGCTTAGAICDVLRIHDVGHFRGQLIGTDLYLTWDWPDSVERVLLVYRYDRLPQGAVDPVAAKTVIYRKTYDQDHGFRMPVRHGENLYLSIHVMVNDQGKNVYSPGVPFQTAKTVIDYRLTMEPNGSVGNKSLGRKSAKEIEYEAKILLTVRDGIPRIPAMEIRKCYGMPPLTREQGVLVEEIPETNDRKLAFVLPRNSLEKDAYIKLFLKNPDDRHTFSLFDPDQSQLLLWKN